MNTQSLARLLRAAVALGALIEVAGGRRRPRHPRRPPKDPRDPRKPRDPKQPPPRQPEE
jgi:hypothetical protein